MDIEVHLFATLRQNRFRSKRITFPPGSTVADICRHLTIGPEEVAIRLVNGQGAERDQPLKPGDAVSLLPALSGG